MVATYLFILHFIPSLWACRKRDTADGLSGTTVLETMVRYYIMKMGEMHATIKNLLLDEDAGKAVKETQHTRK